MFVRENDDPNMERLDRPIYGTLKSQSLET